MPAKKSKIWENPEKGEAMRPKLKSDTFFIPMGESTYLRNNEKSLAIKGKKFAIWLERLTPVLDGQHDLAEICQIVPEDKRALFTDFLSTLIQHGYIQDAANDRVHSLPPEMITLYGPAITFIDAHTDSGGYRFQRFLTNPVLAVASGECLLALVHALLETGNRAISLLDTGEEPTNYGRLQELLSVLQERDPALNVTFLPRNVWQNEVDVRVHCAAASTVLYMGTGDSVAQSARLVECCHHAGVSFLPAVILDNEMHVGPFHHPGQAGCWQCYWQRYQAAHGLPAYTSAGELALTKITRSDIGKPAIGITANMLALEFFKYATNISKNTLDGMVHVLELERLQIVKHRLFPHPLCGFCSLAPANSRQTVLEEIFELVAKQTAEKGLDEAQCEQWIDKNSGIFTRLDDLDYYQLPLIRSQIEVPLASETTYVLPHIKAAGLEYAEVRMSMVRQATARYLESLADARRSCHGTYQQFQKEALHPARISGWRQQIQADTDMLAWVWGVHLTTSLDFTPILLPEAAIAPYSVWNRSSKGLFFAPEAGITSVATSWQQALAEGLCELSLALATSGETPRSSAHIPEALIERKAYRADPLCAAYLAMLDILHARVALVDRTRLCSIPCIAVYLNERYIGLTMHWTALSACRQALQQAVLALQVERTPGPGDEGAQDDAVPLETFPNTLTFTGLPSSLADENDYAMATKKLVVCLEQQGWDSIIVPLARDQTIERLLPCALRVLAVRQERDGTR